MDDKKELLFSLQELVINRLEDIGRAQVKLNAILEHDIFENLSKHNLYWQSEHELESVKLCSIRMQLSSINDSLFELWEVIKPKNEYY